MNDILKQTIAKIVPSDSEAANRAKARLDSLVKPPESLGVLEETAIKLAAVTGDVFYSPDKRRVIVLSADNGVVAEGVASAPQVVTYTQTLNFPKGLTGVSVLAKAFSADLSVIDVGINADINHPEILNKKIRKSTGNITKEAAMTRDECLRALAVGIEAAETAKADGCKVIGVGEMGIGNTTTSSAVLCGLLELHSEDDIEKTVGRGAGLSDEAYRRKISVIRSALDLHKPDSGDAIDVLHKVGGLDLAAMCGVYLGAAANKLPVVIDGFISVVAALCAVRLCPDSADYMFASHFSHERGYALASDTLRIKAPLHLGMRLGEGSGCPLMFALMDGAAAIIKNMGTFEEAQIGTEFMDNIEMDGFNK